MESSRQEQKKEEVTLSETFTDLAGDSIKDVFGRIQRVNEPYVKALERYDELTPGGRNVEEKDEEELKQLLSLINRNQPPKNIVEFRAQIGPIGVVQRWGRKESQEDRMIAGKVPENFPELDETEREQVLKNTVRQLQFISTQLPAGKNSGTTFLSATQVGSKLYTTNVGDSTLFEFAIGKKGQVESRLLNTIHSPENKDELTRIELEGKKVFVSTRGTETGQTVARLGGEIAFSRALGDINHEKIGLSHDPEFKVFDLNVPDGGKLILVNASDGLTEGKKFPMEAIKKIIAENQDKSPNEIAMALSQAALDAGVKDNLTIQVLIVDPKNKTALQMVVLDGHHGDRISDALYKIHNDVLENQILLSRLHRSNPDASKEIANFINTSIKKMNPAQIKEIYASVNICLKNIKDQKQMLAVMSEFTLAVQLAGQPLKTSEELQKIYFSGLDRKYFDDLQNAIQAKTYSLIREGKSHLASDNLEKVKEVRRKITNLNADLESLFKISHVILNIRQAIDPNMPISFVEPAFGNYKKISDASKNHIRTLEDAVFRGFNSVSRKSLDEIIETLETTLNQVTGEAEKQSPAFTLFSKPTLLPHLASAKNDIKNIKEEISRHQESLETMKMKK